MSKSETIIQLNYFLAGIIFRLDRCFVYETVYLYVRKYFSQFVCYKFSCLHFVNSNDNNP